MALLVLGLQFFSSTKSHLAFFLARVSVGAVVYAALVHLLKIEAYRDVLAVARGFVERARTRGEAGQSLAPAE